ncbi:venom protein 164-like [Tetranychus urticae]|uniref:Prokineticin domain-containing protein n=1 Tax=Tetranychus urticae TaxID=32264 RepID=T1JUA7_TETUR|nr:venom protein 164-like [Tetranychus urticae]
MNLSFVCFLLMYFAFGIIVSESFENCWINDECQKDECCVKIANFFGKCKELKKKTEGCNVKEQKQPLKDHVYLVQCPCAESLKCHPTEGIIGLARGTCRNASEDQD